MAAIRPEVLLRLEAGLNRQNIPTFSLEVKRFFSKNNDENSFLLLYGFFYQLFGHDCNPESIQGLRAEYKASLHPEADFAKLSFLAKILGVGTTSNEQALAVLDLAESFLEKAESTQLDVLRVMYLLLPPPPSTEKNAE